MIIRATTPAGSISLTQRAQAALQQRYNLRPGQRVLVVYDSPKERIGKAFALAARRLGARVDVFRLRKNRFSAQTHQSLANKIAQGNYDIFINMIVGTAEESQDRIILVKRQIAAHEDSGGTIVHGPNIEESMLQINFDFPKIIETAKRLKESLNGADEIRIRTALGTNLRLSILGREIHDDVTPKENDFGNFPCGEVYCAPMENSVEGIIIADGSAGGIGILPQPLRFDIKNGRIVRLGWFNTHTPDKTILNRIKEKLFWDKGSSLVAEVGIGLAPYTISGNMLQDEKVAGTVHIAFGDNKFFGGTNTSKTHIDFLIRKPELTVSYSSQKPLCILLRNGNLLI